MYGLSKSVCIALLQVAGLAPAERAIAVLLTAQAPSLVLHRLPLQWQHHINECRLMT